MRYDQPIDDPATVLERWDVPYLLQPDETLTPFQFMERCLRFNRPLAFERTLYVLLSNKPANNVLPPLTGTIIPSTDSKEYRQIRYATPQPTATYPLTLLFKRVIVNTATDTVNPLPIFTVDDRGIAATVSPEEMQEAETLSRDITQSLLAEGKVPYELYLQLVLRRHDMRRFMYTYFMNSPNRVIRGYKGPLPIKYRNKTTRRYGGIKWTSPHLGQS